MLDGIGAAVRAEDWIRNALDRGERLMLRDGVGVRVDAGAIDALRVADGEQEVAAAAGGVEDVEILEGVDQSGEGVAGGGGDATLPGLDDRGADDAEDVGLGGVVGVHAG